MVSEVVSDSSVEKDFEELPEQYARTGISEFWRVDARVELQFEILRQVDGQFVAVNEPDGWCRSVTLIVRSGWFSSLIELVSRPIVWKCDRNRERGKVRCPRPAPPP